MNSTLVVDTLTDVAKTVSVDVVDLLTSGNLLSAQYTASETGAVPRVVGGKLGDLLSVKDFGAVGDGVTDDTAAFQAAFDVLEAGGYHDLYIPAGRYILSARLTCTNTAASKVTLRGDGSEVTVLDWDSATSGLYFLSNDSGDWWFDVDGTTPLAVHFQGLSMVNRQDITNVGIEVQMNGITGRPTMSCTFTDIVWRGYDTFDQGWAKCVVLTDTPNVRFLQCRWFQGGPTAVPNSSIGVEINGTDGGDPAEFYFDQCESFYGAQWIKAGSHVEGIRLTNCTVIGQRALVWTATAESGLVVIGGHYNCSVANFYLDGIFDVTINGANLYNEGHGTNSHQNITIINGGRWAITGCVFVASTSSSGSSIGVLVSNSAGGEAYGGLIDANTFHNYTDNAIVLGGGSQYETVGSNNVYRNCTGRVADLTGLNFIKKSEFSGSTTVTFTNGGTSQSFSVSIPAGMLLAKPTVVDVHAYDMAYKFAYDYNASTATSLVFNGRNLAGTNIAASTAVQVGYRISYV